MSKFFKESIHSDIIIHWTGRDFDPLVSSDPYGPPLQWHEFKNGGRIIDIPEIKEDLLKDKKRKVFPRYSYEHPSVKLGEDLEKKYIERLKNILKFGLWITKDENPEKIRVNGGEFELPCVPRICFTELKLSESRKHAFKYGRLGIGVKRLFLTTRGGQPMYYVNSRGRNLFFPPFIDKERVKEDHYAFFKNMSSKYDLTYDFYSESEWRIIWSSRIDQKYFVNPRGNLEEEFKKYTYHNATFEEFKEYCEQYKNNKRLQYLLPLDGWLAMIIYPSPEVKNKARESGIPDLIKNIKLNNSYRISPSYEQEMMPVELDLDLCAHF